MEESDEFFKLFTPDSLFNIEQRIAEEAAQKKIEKQALEEGEEEETPMHEEEEAKPNPKLEAGKKIPLSLQDEFPSEYIGKPMEDFDEFYDNQKTFVVVGKDKTIYRFSATNALYLLSPFNPLRKGAIFILVHPLFSALIIITIIVNCAFMAMKENPVPDIEYVFTGVYTVEAAIKISARGFIIHNYTYLRDPWNWLDFIVITLAYVTMGVDLGNLSALRTFRVLRALKTVAVIPGLKTIVGALLEAVRRLRDVGILTLFMLSIFALIGMQLYTASLQNRCVKLSDNHNMTDEEFIQHFKNRSNYQLDAFGTELICGNTTDAGKCAPGYQCMNHTGYNPNYGYTHFDNFAVALLCAFRLMTQDYWENLYQITLRANGPWHCLYFMIVILLGSFYLLNLILAIVAMSYDEQQKQDKADSLEEEAERKRRNSFDKLRRGTERSEKEVHFADEKMQEENQEEREEIKKEYRDYLEDKLSHMTKSPSETSISSHNQPDNLSIHSEKQVDDNFLTVGKKETNGDSQKFNHNQICPRHGSTDVDPKDMMVLKDLLDNAEGKRRPSMLSDMSLGEHEEETLRDKLYRKFCSWTCCPCYLKFQKLVALFILDAFMDLFITICIVLNTAFMAIDHHGRSEELGEVLEKGNSVFTWIFAAEAFLKIIALNPVEYVKDGWNCFDILIVMLSFLELILGSGSGLSVLRSFRLLRVFKLAKSWPTLNMLISIVAQTMGALGNLTFVLGIVVFIFAVMGQQLFMTYYEQYGMNGTEFADEEPSPRWSFKDFLHSFMIVFRVLCGEWIESMWSCTRVAGWPCIPFFLLTMVIGNLVVLNLFLALLLSSFDQVSGGDDTDSEDKEPNKIAEAINRFTRFGSWVKVQIIVCLKMRIRRKSKPPVASSSPKESRIDVNGKPEVLTDGHTVIGNGSVCETHPPATVDAEQLTPTTILTETTALLENYEKGGNKTPDSIDGDCNKYKRKGSQGSISKSGASSSSSPSDEETKLSLTKVNADGEPEINEVDVTYASYPDDCFCKICRKKCACCIRVENTKFGKRWWKVRCMTYALVEHKYFESFIITMILASSLALAVEDIYLEDREILKIVLNVADKFFTVIFIMEMLVKWVAFGWKKYFTDAWCWLDFIIVAISIIMLIADTLELSSISAMKAMRTLRALRPLRAVSRWEGMRVVVNALIKAIPSIANVMLVCIVFWLIFGIVGVQFFSGKFFKCLDKDGNKLTPEEVPNKNACLANSDLGYVWKNSRVTFDSVPYSYLALFQVATYKGWIEIMNDAIDTTDIDQQPSKEANVYVYIYFVLFIIFGSFFTLNLFIGVIINNFNQQKKKAGGSLEMFMTEDQKKYYKAMKRMASKAPQKSIPRPSIKVIGWIFDLVTNQKFDIAIMTVIMLNMLTMAMEHHDQDKTFDTVLYYINLSFIIIFTVECVLKLIGLRHFYFKFPWNIFDFIVVVLSILGVALADVMEAYFVSPTLLRVVRVFRVSRILRLVKSAKGIRTLLFSLAVSIPALFNIGLLLFLVMFIYATFGMSFFMKVKHMYGIDDCFNFETFGRSIIYLFQMCTSAGWHTALDGITNEEDCDKTLDEDNCGNYGIGVFYLVSYLIISFLVVVNMYIAVILENFSQATEDVQQGLTTEDFDVYYEKWEKFDPDATQFIPLDKLSDFVDYLEEPLRLPKPNHFMLVKLDIPICEGDKMYCRDILDALTKNFLGTAETGEIGEMAAGDVKEKIQYNPISSTLKRQKEHYAARIIQKAYRRYLNDRGERPPPPEYEKIMMSDTDNNENTQDTESVEKVDEKVDVSQTEATSKPDDVTITISDPDEVASSTENKTVELRADSDVVV